MQFSEKWLREWVNPNIDVQALAHELTMAGLEISAVSPASADLAHVLVGELLTVEAHPDSDRLHVTTVNIATAKPITVVTNVAGLKVGAKVAVATVGASLPDGMKIIEADLRGVHSQGMFCSLKTLGLTEEDDGIHHFSIDATAGERVDVALDLRGDHVLELEITPNRGDCLSLLGIAREVSVVTQSPLTEQAKETVPAATAATFPVSVTAEDFCPRYVGRVIEGVDLQQPIPVWMHEKLRRSGIRSINPAVDVTNYVMLELGQPMHAFDLGQLKGEIQVRAAKHGEHLTLLDGKTITLQDGQGVIADANGPLALAGVMGGEHSGVSDDTTQLFLESAYFEPVHVSKNARHFSLSTDSSYRFERGVDPQLQQRAIERATELLLSIVGGQPGPLIEITSSVHQPKPKTIVLHQPKIARVLGFEIDTPQVESILLSLGMTLASIDAGWQVSVPLHRHDISIEEDLIEELVRVYGYDNIPTHQLIEPLISTLANERSTSLSAIKNVLVERGYQEVVTYSFVDEQCQRLLAPEHDCIALTNPISSDLGVMRTNGWAGLVQVLQHNLNRQQKRGRFMETGLRFRQQGTETAQTPILAGLICGSDKNEQWGENTRRCDFYDMKNDVQALFALAGQSVTYTASEHPALHPGQQAEIRLNDVVIGLMGQCHPDVRERLKISEPFFLFEIEQQYLKQAVVPSFQSVSKFPFVRRDLGLVVKNDIEAQILLDKILSMKSTILKDAFIFDVYTGEGLAENEKSVAISLIFQHLSHTLKESEVNESTDMIVASLAETTGARLRDW